jgi:threonine dehydrogenase-like Zn-dependent dehydrogenase
MFLVRLLSLQNALQIIVVEQNPLLKRLATQFGATHVLDPRDIDISESVRLLTDDMGADVVFQISDQYDYEPTQDIATTSTAILKRRKAKNAANSSAIAACRTRGTIVNIAPREMYEARKSKFRNELMMHEVQYIGSAGYDFASLKAAVGLMERGDVNFEGISLA